MGAPARPLEIDYRLLGLTTVAVMVGELPIVVIQLLRVECLNGLRRACMRNPAPLPGKGRIGHLLGEHMLEDILKLWSSRSLVEKLGRLQVREPLAERSVGLVHDPREERCRDPRADDRQRLQQRLLLRHQSIDAGRQYLLHGRRDLEVSERCRGVGNPIGHPPHIWPSQHTLIHECLDDLC